MIAALTIDPIIPVGIVIFLAAACAIVTVFAYVKTGATVSLGQRMTLLGLRLAGIGILLSLLLQPSRIETVDPPDLERVTVIAIDDSQSMAQRDTEQGTRTEAAKSLLRDAEIIVDGKPTDPKLRMFRFSQEAVPLNSLSDLTAEGKTTRMHQSLTGMVGGLRAQEAAGAIILLSDGHDFELVNPTRTGFNARARQAPIYAVPLGRQGKVRDVAARITNWQPYTYVKQKGRIQVSLRLIGCELQPIQVRLKRDGVVVQNKTLPPTQDPEASVQFEVLEDKVGQYEYEVEVPPIDGEGDAENNRAITYLNVIDQEIQVLFLEGEPYWDTTFLQRSLLRNDKTNVDSIVQYAQGKARLIRKKANERELKVPQTRDEWAVYDVVVLGRSVHQLIGKESLDKLTEHVREGGGTVIFSRGPAFTGPLANNELEPVVWGADPTRHARLQPAREGQSVAPFKLISEKNAAQESLPELIAARPIAERKPLAATLAQAQLSDGEPLPGIIHRRFGSGQVLSVGVDGLWRWAFNARADGPNTIFDRFWDQMILWLMADRDFTSTQLRASTANVPIGEKIYFRALVRDPKKRANEAPLTIRRGQEEVARITLSRDALNAERLVGEFLPAKPGRYEATARFVDGSEHKVRFMAFDENLEKTEVATDTGYLRALCESSGGRLLRPDELGPLVRELGASKSGAAPETRLVPIWDSFEVFWIIGLLFGADWFLRRRWGLT